MSQQFDIGIVGGGIVGLATAYQLSRSHPHLRLVVLEKEAAPAAHQTGHNSGVIHSGLYYRPGSAKAATCVRGGELLKAFCDEHGVPYKLCGKVVVATTEEEIPRLEDLHGRGTANGVPELSLIGPERLREIEPHATSGIQALHVPQAGIIDYTAVTRALASALEAVGGELRLGVRVTASRSGSAPTRPSGSLTTARWCSRTSGRQRRRPKRRS